MDWLRFSNPIATTQAKPDRVTADEIHQHVEEMGYEGPVYWSRDDMSETEDITYWLRTKTKLEGEPTDLSLIERIGKEGIRRPVILDLDADMAVEGRHRLAAAKKFGLDVPVVMITMSKMEGWEVL